MLARNFIWLKNVCTVKDMATLKGIIGTFKVAKNPFSIIFAKFTGKRKKISLVNGAKFQITWPQFRFLRDHYFLVEKYYLEQVSDESFKIHVDGYQMVGSLVLVCTWEEIQTGIYDYEFKNKVVLDIGGFEGESAVYFWSKGAKKVIIYEPVLYHLNYIKENVFVNKIDAEIHGEGIGDKDGNLTVAYNQTDNSFGLETGRELTKKLTIKIRDIAKVIAESKADVAKIDCEGAELSLVSVKKEILRTLEYVIVEAHSLDIRKALIKKFKESDFAFVKGNKEESQEISVLYFKRF